MFGALRPLGRLRPFGSLGAWAPPPAPAAFDGPDLPTAFRAWWKAQAALQSLLEPFPFEDGPAVVLWHLEAPEGQAAPYAVYFLASEAEDGQRTTAFAVQTAVIQVNVHAETDAQARAIRRAIRRAVLNAPLSIDGRTVRYVLPGGQATRVGEGFLPGGRDSWVATLEVEIQHEIDHT